MRCMDQAFDVNATQELRVANSVKYQSSTWRDVSFPKLLSACAELTW